MDTFRTFLALGLLALCQFSSAEECIDRKDKQLDSCCKVPELFPTVTTRECHLRARNMTALNDTLGYLSCFHECVSTESGAITAGHTVNVDRYYEMAGLFNEAIKHTYRLAIDRCFEMPVQPYTGPELACDIFALNFNLCIIRMVALYCPREVASDAEICKKYRIGVPFCRERTAVV